MDKVRKSVATPKSALLTLTPSEVNALCVPQSSQVYELFKKCALAVLTSGLQSDDPDFLSEHYADFDVRFERSDRGIALHLTNAPAEAYVDGELVAGLQEHLFAVLRDIIYVQNELQWPRSDDAFDSADATESVFKILRHANAVKRGRQHGLVVCWGGHSISREEYDYSKELGYELGLRGLDICTGCNELIIMPDIEKRLEAFVRLAHAIIIFPGGAGTAEEILYLLSVLSAPQNQQQKLPVILTGPASGKAYFETIISFIANSLGEEYAERVEVRIDDAAHVAADIKKGVEAVFAYRDAVDDAQYFNWSMSIDTDLQQPFEATHEKMAALQLSGDLPAHVLARNLRSAFSGIVSGNVKKDGIERIRQHGPFQIHADAEIGRQLDELLAGFVADQRMRLPGTVYKPCYEIIRPRN